MQVTMKGVRYNTEEKATHFSYRQMSWSNAVSLTLLCKLLRTFHTLLIPYTVATWQGKAVSHWSKTSNILSFRCPTQAVGDSHSECGTNKDNAQNHHETAYRLVPIYFSCGWLKSISLPEVKALQLYFKSFLFNYRSLQRKQNKVTVHVPWLDHITAGVASRMNDSFYEELIKLVAWALECIK